MKKLDEKIKLYQAVFRTSNKQVANLQRLLNRAESEHAKIFFKLLKLYNTKRVLLSKNKSQLYLNEI